MTLVGGVVEARRALRRPAADRLGLLRSLVCPSRRLGARLGAASPHDIGEAGDRGTVGGAATGLPAEGVRPEPAAERRRGRKPLLPAGGQPLGVGLRSSVDRWAPARAVSVTAPPRCLDEDAGARPRAPPLGDGRPADSQQAVKTMSTILRARSVRGTPAERSGSGLGIFRDQRSHQTAMARPTEGLEGRARDRRAARSKSGLCSLYVLSSCPRVQMAQAAGSGVVPP